MSVWVWWLDAVNDCKVRDYRRLFDLGCGLEGWLVGLMINLRLRKLQVTGSIRCHLTDWADMDNIRPSHRLRKDSLCLREFDRRSCLVTFLRFHPAGLIGLIWGLLLNPSLRLSQRVQLNLVLGRDGRDQPRRPEVVTRKRFA